jgi:hypothetical protein
MSKFGGVEGFDPDLTGFNCAGEVDPRQFAPGESWYCPFTPGCGAKSPSECPEAKRRAKISQAPERVQ